MPFLTSPTLLLTWHGTLVCLREGGGGLVHLKLPTAEPGSVPLELDPADWPAELPAAGITQKHPALGLITVRPAPNGHGLSLMRYGRFLCAEPRGVQMAFDRPAANAWESFLPVSADDLAGLQRLLARRWILAGTRHLLRRGEVALTDGFRLQLGRSQLDLETCLPLPPDAADRIVLGDGEARIELLEAKPRSSALVKTELWPVRARRVAEILTLAVHRQLAGREPEQEVFERDTEFLTERRGPAGLEDLMEALRERSGSDDAGGVPALPPEAARPIVQPIVPLGTGCVPACALRRMQIDRAPLPFDWLGTTPAMIRHCLETDFSVLLDRSQYRSLTGQNRPYEPKDGCAHEYYAANFGIARVFNHNDPTRDADYRYTEACVDRLRDILASPGPKMFVQVREAGAAARKDFEANAALLDRLTRNATLLQVAVSQPDRRLAVPTLGIVARQGAHALYRMQPVSQLGGEAFRNPADNNVLAALIAAHGSRPAASLLIPPADRAAVQQANGRFGGDRPMAASTDGAPDNDGVNDEIGRQALAERANQSLMRFLEAVGLPRRFRFASVERVSPAASETNVLHLTGQQAVLRVDLNRPDPWTLLARSLPIAYLLDALLALGPLADMKVRVEVGDHAYDAKSIAYCSKLPGTCLLPDPDFFASGGYDDTRRLTAGRAQEWTTRRDTVFWRGATTGGRRHAAPDDGQPDDFTWLPRLQLCRQAQTSPLARHYDMGITNICRIDEPHLIARITEAGLLRPPVPRSGFLGHKAILVIDGNSNAWSALFNALLTGACVLIVASPQGFRQWYYDALQPFVNYLPVASDLGDLDERVEWLLSHDAEAQAIGQAGRVLALSMSFETVMEDAAHRLRAWMLAAGGA